MQIDDFWKALHEKSGYETPPDVHRNLYGRLLSGRLDCFYYADVTHVVFSANRCARHGQFDRLTWARHGLRMLQAAERAGGRARFSGFDNIAKARLPVVYTSNHMSVVDTTILPAALLGFGDVATVVKESLMTYPLFGRVMRATDPISVTRRDAREDLKLVMTRGEAFLRAGRSVLIFPQATREPGFNPSEFNSLGVKLARNAGEASKRARNCAARLGKEGKAFGAKVLFFSAKVDAESGRPSWEGPGRGSPRLALVSAAARSASQPAARQARSSPPQ